MKKSTLLAAASTCIAAGCVIFALTYFASKRPRFGSEVKITKATGNSKEANAKGTNEPWLTDYDLTERTGATFGRKDLLGKVHVVSFFFASCPGTCREQNNRLAGVHSEFKAKGVKFVSITCDPETDTPAKLREYALLYSAPEDSWKFLTGELPYIRRVAAEVYRVPLDLKTHVEKFLVVDQTGKLRGSFSWGNASSMKEMRLLIDELLAHPPTVSEESDSKTEPNSDSKTESDSESPSHNEQALADADEDEPKEEPN